MWFGDFTPPPHRVARKRKYHTPTHPPDVWFIHLATPSTIEVQKVTGTNGAGVTGTRAMDGLDADRLVNLLQRLVAACERIAGHVSCDPAVSGGGRRARPAAADTGPAVEAPASVDALRLPVEVSTAQAAEILGVSKDTVLEYKRKGLIPYRDLAPPGSTKPVFMYPLDAVVGLRTSYQTDAPAPEVPREPSRRSVKGRRKFKHLVINDDEA